MFLNKKIQKTALKIVEEELRLLETDNVVLAELAAAEERWNVFLKDSGLGDALNKLAE